MKTFSVPFICETGSMVAKPSLPSNIKLLGSWNSQLGAAELVTGYSNPSGLTHKTVLVGSSPCQSIQYESNYVPNPRSLASRFLFLFFISIGFLHLLQHTECPMILLNFGVKFNTVPLQTNWPWIFLSNLNLSLRG